MFELFVVSGVYTSRLSDLAGAMHLFVVGLLTACGLSGVIRFDGRRVLGFVAVAAAIGVVSVGGSRLYLHSSIDAEYRKDKIVANMHLLLADGNAVVHRTVPEKSPEERADYRGLSRIRETGVLRVGYHPDNLPFSFFNANGDLVGFDVDMAHLLAQELDCRLEFVPFDFNAMAEQLEANDFDIIMSGVGVLTRRLELMRFTDPYLHATVALVVPDHAVAEYTERLATGEFDGARLAVARSPYVRDRLAEMLPGAEVVEFDELRDFFEQDHDVEALVHGAESASAWTLLYPGFSVVVPRGGGRKIPVAYPVGRNDEAFEDFMNHWIELKRGSGDLDRIYNHWILGKGSERRGPRWSIIRDVLGWVD
jgi:ABC-type amino acid transport substrate-binding protein